ncbi:MAG: ABC transporter substrate-binding protein [Micropruina sp.]|uniref:ABC transporter substrate-binding protein n=1 Tax=Micropruina sp. TaxID=2737536 RepID=UPI0039E2E688
MTQARTMRAVAAAVSVGALLATAACSSGTPAAPASSGAGTSTANWDEFGPITYVAGKDVSGNRKKEIAEWNAANPNEKVTFLELSDNADEQRAQMIQRGQAKSGEYSILSVDVVWTSEFAANGWLEALPADKFKTEGYLKAAVDSATYFNKLYAMPESSDGALLFYRKDLLSKAGIDKPPTTMAEMKTICDKVLPDNPGMSCFGGQFDKYEGLTCNVAEAINSAGGSFLTPEGKPSVNTAQAVAGLQWIVDSFKSGFIPENAITWKEEPTRFAFQDSKILFMRNWSGTGGSMDKDTKVTGKYATAPLAGVSGPGVSTLGGHSFGISTFTKNKGTAMKFINWMSTKDMQIARMKATSNAPVIQAIYDDPALQKQFPYLKDLGAGIANAQPRPKAVKYGDVTQAIQDASYAALKGQKDPKTALDELQAKLETLTK